MLGRFLRALGMDSATVPRDVEERAECYRNLLAGRRVLMLLDNAAHEQQIRPLLPGGSTYAVVLTSRDRLAGLAGVDRLELGVLDPEEAIDLLSRIVGESRVAEERPQASDIVEWFGRMPLAIRIAGARLATRQRWPLKLLAEPLLDGGRERWGAAGFAFPPVGGQAGRGRIDRRAQPQLQQVDRGRRG